MIETFESSTHTIKRYKNGGIAITESDGDYDWLYLDPTQITALREYFEHKQTQTPNDEWRDTEHPNRTVKTLPDESIRVLDEKTGGWIRFFPNDPLLKTQTWGVDTALRYLKSRLP